MDLTKDGKFERSDDWSSCAYYLDRPENNLPHSTPPRSAWPGYKCRSTSESAILQLAPYRHTK